MNTITIGVDLAKNTFSTCEVNFAGRVLQRRDLRRDDFSAWLAQRPAGTVVAMEACSGAHHWARRCRELGLEPRVIAAQFVTPFRKSRLTKNDRNDAEAIATAARQGNMRFVPIKSVEQQARLAWHRAREGYKTEGLAISNRLRGLLAEFGFIVAKGDLALRRALSDLSESAALPLAVKVLIDDLNDHWIAVRERVKVCEARIGDHARADERCAHLRAIIGVGAITADAVVATVGSATEFKNGRQMAAWLGLVPTQHTTGGHVRLGKISCRGDAYLRTLLIQGARSSLQRAKTASIDKRTPEQIWIQSLACRLPFGKVIVAIANKHARQIWAILARAEHYDAEAWMKHPMVQRPASGHAKAGAAMA